MANFPILKAGVGFGVPVDFKHKNENLRFYERIYMIFDVMPDGSIKYYTIELFVSEISFAKWQANMPDVLTTETNKTPYIMVPHKNLFHVEKKIFIDILTQEKAEYL